MKTIVFIGGAKACASYDKVKKLLGTLIDGEDIGIVALRSFSVASVNKMLEGQLDKEEPWRAIVLSDLSQENLYGAICSARRLAEAKLSDESDSACTTGSAVNADDINRRNLLINSLCCMEEDGEAVKALADAGIMPNPPDSAAAFLVDLSKKPPLPEFYDNPFDFVVNFGLNRYPEQARHPFVELLQVLCGLPAHVLDDGCPGVDSSTRLRAFSKELKRLEKQDRVAHRILDCGISALDVRAMAASETGFGVARLDEDDRRDWFVEAMRAELREGLSSEGRDSGEPMSISFVEDKCDEKTTVVRAQFENAIAEAIAREYPESTRDGYDMHRLNLDYRRPESVLALSFRCAPRNISASCHERQRVDFGSVASEFYVRNHYPDTVKFLVWDVEQHDADLIGSGSATTRQELGFWMAVLTLALDENEHVACRIPSYTLNNLAISLDYEEFVRELRSKWALARSAKTLLREQIRSLEDELVPDVDEKKTLPDTTVDIRVDMSEAEDGVYLVDKHRYGWLKDSVKPYPIEQGTLEERAAVRHPPRHGAGDGAKNFFFGLGSIPRRMKEMPPMDEARFGEDYNKVEVGMTAMLRAPRRALAIAAERFRKEPPIEEDVLTSFRLNDCDILDFKEDLEKEELSLASDCSLSSLSSDAYRRRQERLRDRVKARMKTRAYLREVVGVFALLSVASLLAFVPFVCGFAGGAGASGQALLLCFGFVVVVLLGGFIPLKLSHLDVKDKIRDFNLGIEYLVNDFQVKARRIGERISRYASYRKAYSLYRAQRTNSKPYTSRLKELYKMSRDVDRILENYGDDTGIVGSDAIGPKDPKFETWFEAEAALNQAGYFEFFPDYLYETRPLNKESDAGDSVSVPYDFIRSLDISQIVVTDPRIPHFGSRAFAMQSKMATEDDPLNPDGRGEPSLGEQNTEGLGEQDAFDSEEHDAVDTGYQNTENANIADVDRYGRASIEAQREEPHVR